MAKTCLFVTSLLLATMFNVSFSAPTSHIEAIQQLVDLKTMVKEVPDSSPIWEHLNEDTTKSTNDYDYSFEDVVTETNTAETTTESTRDGDPHWEPFNPETSALPSDAIIGGYENETLYIIRSRYKGCLSPGKFIPSQHKGYIPWGYKAHERDELEILRGNNYKWVQTTKNIPKGAVIGGISERNNDPLYVCRGKHLDFIIPGKIDPHFKSCYIPYGDLEVERGIGNYETLVIPEEITPPAIISKSSDVYQSIEGKDSLKIPCETIGYPEPIITWKIDNTTISNDSKYSIEDGNLIIKNPTVSDSQRYTCEANNDAGSVSATFQAEILQVPQIQGEEYQRAVLGEPVEIKCITKGVPKPVLTWEFRPQDRFEFVLVQSFDNVLKIPVVKSNQEGVYRCRARNDVGEKIHHTKLIITGSPPVIISDYPIYKGIEGKDKILRVPCVATGHPKPIITWYLNGVAIAQDSKFSIEDESLVIKNPMVIDSQMYKCEANNEFGSAQAMIKVEITPEIIDDPSPLSSQILRSFFSRWFQSSPETSSDANYADDSPHH